MDEKIELPIRGAFLCELPVKRIEFYCSKLFTTLHLFVSEEVFEGLNYKYFKELLSLNPIPSLSVSSPPPLLVKLDGSYSPYIQLELSSKPLLIQELLSFAVKSELINISIAEETFEKIKITLEKIFSRPILKGYLELPEIFLKPRRFSATPRRHVFPPVTEQLASPLSEFSLEKIPLSRRQAPSSHKEHSLQKQSFFSKASSDTLSEIHLEEDSSIGSDPIPRHNTPKRHAPSPMSEDLTSCFGIRSISSRGRPTDSIRIHSSRSSAAFDESPLSMPCSYINR